MVCAVIAVLKELVKNFGTLININYKTMNKIQIKSIYGSILFEYEKENNTVKETLVEAVKRNADLTGAYLIDTDLRFACLRGAYLIGSDLRNTDLRNTDLRFAYLRGADLTGSDLRFAELTSAGENKITIKKATVFTGLYDYLVLPIIDENDIKWVKMGCFLRTVEDWDKNFWNNDKEFPNDGSIKSKSRLFAYETAKKWFDII